MSKEIGVEDACSRVSKAAGSFEWAFKDEPTAATVIAGVLEQFSRHFLLNDHGAELAMATVEPLAISPQWSVPHHQPCRRESDEERIHQARVSVRRIGSTIRTFENLIDPSWAASITNELSWYGKILGAQRDLHVLRSALEKAMGLVAVTSDRLVVLGALDHAIEETGERAALERSSARFVQLVEEIVQLSSTIHFVAVAGESARTSLASQLISPWRDVSSRCHDARSDSSDERLHELRKALKRLQYASETVAIVKGSRAERIAHFSGSLQRRLGLVHDASVAQEWLEILRTTEPSIRPSTDSLLEHFRVVHRDARRGWRHDMDRVKRAWYQWDEPRRKN
jgi:CHAD domain-containing protein